MDEESPKKIEVPESTLLHLICSFNYACKYLGDVSNIATDLNWYDLCWLNGRQRIETLTPEEREKLLTNVIEFEKVPA